MKNFLKKNYKNILLKILIVALIVVVDLLSKSLLKRAYINGHTPITIIDCVISFVYTENTGAAFSIFSGNVLFLILFSIIFVGVFIYLDITTKEKNVLQLLGFTFVVGGAVGNMIDRIFLGYVRDFISFDFLKNFAICNVADCFITVGCVLYLVYFLVVLFRNKEKK